MFQETSAYRKINALKKRIRVVQGGTSASKTISILLYLIAYAQTDKTPTITSIVSESIPHLKRGAMRDFQNILKAHHYWKDKNWNVQDSTYTFETGSKIEFFSTDNGDKLRGARRDRTFMNEANNCTFDAFEQLEVRTKEFVIVDYNPTNEFWVFTEIIPKRTDVDYLTLTYKDNEACPPEIVASIEQRKSRPSWWKVYGLGELGEVEGRILTGWQIIDEIPHEARLERHGLDFGYTNDETGIVDIYYYNGGYIWDEITYQKGLGNKQIADILLNLDRVLTVGDSAEPKSIDEVRSYGVNIIGVSKKSGETKSETFVKWSFGILQNEKISVTKRSVNLIKEYRNLLWATDKEGRILNVEDPSCKNHLISAGRYGMVSLTPVIRQKEMIDNMPRYEQRKRINQAR